ncbi:MAG: hypothetical protein C0501_15620 [Isosphaera sp.]|nr:hypothetical protein [Isosphaera sp.]
MPASPAEIARRALADHLAALPAGHLLNRYAASRDPEAFAGLVHQFGPLVLGTCRRVLGPSADADDAFQAVFLALSRQSESFRDAKALPAWLHRVALRVSRKALARRTPSAALPDAVADPADPFADVAWRDVRRVLDEEVDGLPEKYRGPVVLCWLDGLTRDEAAGKLGLSLNTLARRLDAGRELLRSRLTRRGLAPVLVTAAVANPTGLRAVVPEALRVLAVELGVGAEVSQAVMALAAVRVAAGGRGLLKAVTALVLVGGAAAGGVVAFRTGPPPKPEADPPGTVRIDGPEEPFPPGAVARFGTTRFRAPFPITGAALSPDGTRLAVGGSAEVAVYEVGTWRRLSGVRLNRGDGSARLSFTPGGEQVAYSWDTRDDSLEAQLRPGTLDISSGRREAFTEGRVDPDGLYHPEAPPATSPRWTRHADGWRCRTPDGMHEIRACFGIRGWTVLDAATGREVVRLTPTPTRGGGRLRDLLCLAPDGRTVARVADEFAGVEIWDAASWQRRAVLPSPIGPDTREGFQNLWSSRGLWYSADGRRVALRLRTGDVARWEVDTGRELPLLRTGSRWKDVGASTPPTFAVGCYDLPGGRFTVTPRADGDVRVWDTATGGEVPVPHRYESRLRGCQSADGRYLALADAGGRIDLWDAASGGFIRTLREGGSPVGGVALNADGSRLAFATLPSRFRNEYDAVRLVSTIDGRESGSAAARNFVSEGFVPLSFANNDRQVVIGSGWGHVWNPGTDHVSSFVNFRWVAPGGNAWIFEQHAPPRHTDYVAVDVRTGREIWRRDKRFGTEWHEHILDHRSVSADGRVVAVSTQHRLGSLGAASVSVLRSRSGGDAEETRIEFRPRLPEAERWQARVRFVALSPDGSRVLIAVQRAAGQVNQVWDAEAGRLLATFEADASDAWFSPDGRSIFAVLGDAGACLRYDIEKLIAAEKK